MEGFIAQESKQEATEVSFLCKKWRKIMQVYPFTLNPRAERTAAAISPLDKECPLSLLCCSVCDYLDPISDAL